MPKESTLNIQESIKLLGERLGFISVMEERIHDNNFYAPIYDVVWYLDLSKVFNMESLKPLFVNNPRQYEKLLKLPFAGFEIEGANTSSKNQISNFANLYSGHFVYNFVVVNNDGAKNEEDTYRRGIKINSYFRQMSGMKNVYFLDKKHLNEAIEKYVDCDTAIKYTETKVEDRSKFGGENRSVGVYEKIKDSLISTGMIFKQNWSPEFGKLLFKIDSKCVTNDKFTDFVLHKRYYASPYELEAKVSKKTSDSYYVPKLDVVLGFNAPESFKEWMKCLSVAVKEQYVDYPILFGLREKLLSEIFIPLISIEIETSINKHLNGGIFNMSKNSYCGILVTEEEAASHLQFFAKEMGINNVVTYCVS